MAAELVIEASTATLVLEVSQGGGGGGGGGGPQGESAVLANGVTSVTLRTASGAEFALSVDDDGMLTTTRL